MDVRLYNERISQSVDALYGAIVLCGELQFLPELLEIFGQKQFLDFMNVFAGQTIIVPPREVFETKVRDVLFWVELGRNAEAAIPLAAEFGMTASEVRRRAKEVDIRMSALGVRREHQQDVHGMRAGVSAADIAAPANSPRDSDVG